MADDWSANTDLLLHMEGSNNSTTFTDSSLINKVITVNGNTKISTTKSKWGNGSGYFDGNGDYLSVEASITNDSLTIELWFASGDYTTRASSGSFIGYYPGSAVNGRWYCAIQNTGKLVVWCAPNTYLCTTVIPNDGAWHHAAFVVDTVNNNMVVYLDGVADGTFSRPTFNITSTTRVGIYNPSGGDQGAYIGYMQDLRVTKGVARYTANFTPPSRLPDPDLPYGMIQTGHYRHDVYDSGKYRITGTVTELGVAGPYRVRIFDRQSARCVRETWSNASGVYAFNNLAYRANGYFAVAYDHGDNPLNAAIADLITPELMP